MSVSKVDRAVLALSAAAYLLEQIGHTSIEWTDETDAVREQIAEAIAGFRPAEGDS